MGAVPWVGHERLIRDRKDEPIDLLSCREPRHRWPQDGGIANESNRAG